MLRVFSRAALLFSFCVVTAAAQAQTVDELVAKNLKAKGGAEKWKTVQSVKMTGKVTMLQGPGAKELPLTVYAKRPNFNRQEVTIQDKQFVQAFDGSGGWMINPMMGTEAPQAMPAGQAELMKNGADFDGALIDYKAKGHTIDLVGKEKLDGRDVYRLKVTMKGGHVQHYLLDAESGLEVKTSTEMDLMGTGMKQPLETEMSNFQQVDGIMVPHTVKQLMGGKPMVQMTIEKVEFNPKIDDAIFKMPATK